MPHIEDSRRSLIKTLTYRILIILSTMTIVFLFTGDRRVTFEVTGISTLINTVLYYFHERIWNKVHWGKKKI